MALIRTVSNNADTIDELLIYFSKIKISGNSSLQNTFEALTYTLSTSLDMDRCGIWFFDQTRTVLTCKNLFDRKTGSYSAGQQIVLPAFPPYFNAIKNRRAVIIANARDNELTKDFWTRYLEKINVNSILNFGIWEQGEIIGVLSLADSRLESPLSRDKILSIIPFADLCGRWIQAAKTKPFLKSTYALDNESLLRELAYLCRKSETLSLNETIQKSLISFNTLLKIMDSNVVVFNQQHAYLYSSRMNTPKLQIEPFQAFNIHRIAKESKLLWLENTQSLAIGLPSILNKIITMSGNPLAIIPSLNPTKESRWDFLLLLEFPKVIHHLEEQRILAVNQISTAFSIILDYADTKSFLKQSLSLAKGAFEGSNIGMAIVDQTLKVTKINKSLKNILKNEMHLLSNIIPKHLSRSNSTTLKLASGEEKYIYSNLSPIESNILDNKHYLLQVIDITKQKKSITALKEQELLFRSVIDINPAFIFAKSLDGTFVLANQSVSQVYGTSPESMIGKKDSDYNNNPMQVKKFRDDDARVILGRKEIYISEEEITDSQGNTRYLQTIKKPILNPHDGTYLVLGVSTDITEKKHAELLSKQIAPHDQISSQEIQEPCLKNRNIILIDEDHLSGDVTHEMLLLSGANSLCSNDIDSAISRIKDSSLIISAVVLDINVPNIDKEHAYYTIRKLRPSMPILCISGYAEQQTINKLLVFKNTAFLSKPFSYERLIRAIDSLIKLDSANADYNRQCGCSYNASK